MELKEKVVLESRNKAYIVRSLSNRTTPKIGAVLNEKDVDDLLIEAKTKRHGTLTISIK